MSIMDALPNPHREPCEKPFIGDARLGAGNGDLGARAMMRPCAPPNDRSPL